MKNVVITLNYDCIFLNRYREQSFPVFKNGHLIGFSGIAQDITKEKENALSLQAENDKSLIYIKNIIDNVPHSIFWKDSDSRFLGCNQAFAKTAGLTDGSHIIGKTDYDLPWGKDEAGAYRDDDKKVMHSGCPKLNIEETQTTRDGKKITLLTSKVPLVNRNGKVFGVLGIYTDITHLKEMENSLLQAKSEAEKASQAKSEFIANVSHDIRTPITGMLGLIDSLIETAENEMRREDASLLKGATLELLHLLNEVIEVVRMENGHLQAESETFSVRELAEHNIALLKPDARHKNMQLEFSIDDNVPDKIIGQRYSVDRILLNLLGNAAKFTTRGHIRLSIKLLEKESDTVKLKFSVEDTGIGIPADKLNKIFDRFVRLTPSYKGIYKGNGLGLYNVKQYVDAMGGHIDLESIEGQGSTFSVELPFTLAQQENISQSEGVVTLPVKQGAPSLLVKQECNNDVEVIDPVAIVLVVEDNPLAAYTLKNLLKKNQCAADVVTTGEDAVKKSQEKEYHLILMDIGLPGIDGIEATRRIRQHLDAKTTPIIAVTGHVEIDKKQQCLEAGMQDVFNKPLDIPGLQKILGKYRFNVGAFEPLETIDLKDGARLIGGSVDSAKEMLAILIKDLEHDLKEIKQTADANNMNQLYDLIHRLYGGLCYCGVPRLRFLAKQLKEALLAKTYDHIIGYVNELLEEGQNVLKEGRGI